MSMTHEERKAYQRGYNAGVSGRWPTHLPPAPPVGVVRELMEAAKALRDMADTYHATLPKDDEMAKDFAPLIDRIDDVFEHISDWLKAQQPPAQG
jgi:hypothetical protein